MSSGSMLHMLPFLPLEIEQLIHEYCQDPDQMVLTYNGKPRINRDSPFVNELGGLLLMHCYYRLCDVSTISNGNKVLYEQGKQYYKLQLHVLV